MIDRINNISATVAIISGPISGINSTNSLLSVLGFFIAILSGLLWLHQRRNP